MNMKQIIQIADKPTLDAVANNTEKYIGTGTEIKGLLETLTAKVNTLENKLNTLTTNVSSISTKVNSIESNSGDNYVAPDGGLLSYTTNISKSGRGVLRVVSNNPTVNIKNLQVDGQIVATGGYTLYSSAYVNQRYFLSIPFSKSISCTLNYTTSDQIYYHITPL